MRILVLTTCYPTRSRPDYGIFAHRQTRALADLGAECHVLQPVDWAPPAPFHRLHPGWESGRSRRLDGLRELDGIPIHHPPVYHPKPSRFFPGDTLERTGIWTARAIARRPELRGADLLFAHFLCNEGYAGLIVKRRLGLPLAVLAQGDDVHAWPERWPDRVPKLAAVLAGADALFACSAGLARDAERWASAGLAAPIEVAYNGIETAVYRPARDGAEQARARRDLGLPEAGRLLLSVGTTIAAKGWPELLDVFAASPAARGWTLLGVGTSRGNGDLDLPAEAARRGLAERFRWLGVLPPARMPDLYRAADAFVLASHNEGLSNAVQEAMASGLPTIATEVGGHAELLGRGEGWLVPPRDPAALGRAFTEALGDPTEADRRGRLGRARAEALGTPRANAARLLARFEALLRARRDAAPARAV
ncbi:MAG TPA: glycosyltransferase [Thermoanaerobaculia bacterium]|nr:glycosyltransferase [Thermoanaerobaculia bacterium]